MTERQVELIFFTEKGATLYLNEMKVLGYENLIMTQTSAKKFIVGLKPTTGEEEDEGQK
jgi:hypothetical protein